jgi:hypothetical protein
VLCLAIHSFFLYPKVARKTGSSHFQTACFFEHLTMRSRKVHQVGQMRQKMAASATAEQMHAVGWREGKSEACTHT